MALVDDVLSALQEGARAGVATVKQSGRDISEDIETFVIPHLADVGVHIASIVQKRANNIYTDVTARDLLDSQRDAIKTIVEIAVTLLVLEVQKLIDAIWSALGSLVNRVLGVALL